METLYLMSQSSNDRMTWKSEYSEDFDNTEVYALLIDEDGYIDLKLEIATYQGNIDEDKSRKLFARYINQMLILTQIGNCQAMLYGHIDLLKDASDEYDKLVANKIEVITDLLSHYFDEFKGFDVNIYNFINEQTTFYEVGNFIAKCEK